MGALQAGCYEIVCVLIDAETVLNNEGVRRLEIRRHSWEILPAKQKFEIEQIHAYGAMLTSNGQRYFAQFRQLRPGTILIDLKREGVNQTISIEANLVKATVYADTDQPSVADANTYQF